ncbi:MAG: sigma-70 family RNA polymerase sigma factor [Eubacterium sp.]|nr:sigma-70 family RNA polymerase sigma factor [Eubacterium sp.]
MKSNEEFCENIQHCKKAMYALAFSILKNDFDAADAISEAILKAFSNINSLKNDKYFKTWILKILHNTCLEMLSKNPPSLNIDDQYDMEDLAVSDTAVSLSLREAVESLKNPYRTVTILYYYEDLSIKEIAAITQCSVPAAKKQLSRARKMLKEILNKEDFFN